MLGPADVGHRVVVRRYVGLRDNRPIYTDVLGQLTRATASDLTIETKRGTVVVPVNDVHRAKRVPPRRRPTARDVMALERVAAAGWPAPETGWLGEWLLRAGGGWTRRANSALPLGDPGLPLPAAIDAVSAWYAERGLRPAITTPLPASAPVAHVLAERGWSADASALVQIAPLTALLAEGPKLGKVTVAPAPSEAWLAVVAARKGSLPDVARTILSAPCEVRFAHGYSDSGALVA